LNTAISSQDDYTTGSTTDPSIDALPDATLELAEDPEIHSKKSVNILANPEPTDTIMISNEIAVTFYLDLHRIVLDRGTAIAVIEPLGKIFSTLALLHPKNYSTITTTIGTVAFKNNNGIYKRFLDTVERGIGQSNENHWFVINHGTCPASETAAARRILDLTSSPNGSKPSLITHVSCSPDGLGSGRTLSLLLPDTPILGADTALTLTKFRTQNSFNPPLVLNKMLSTAQPKDQSWYSWENGIVKKIDETDLSKFILLDINQLTGLAIGANRPRRKCNLLEVQAPSRKSTIAHMQYLKN